MPVVDVADHPLPYSALIAKMRAMLAAGDYRGFRREFLVLRATMEDWKALIVRIMVAEEGLDLNYLLRGASACAFHLAVLRVMPLSVSVGLGTAPSAPWTTWRRFSMNDGIEP